MKNLLRIITVLVAMTPVVAVLLFVAGGGRLATVETPSMATYAPVGTLVVSEPVKISDLHVGEMILFTPPGESRTYFHRIADISDQGISTKGDLNPDPDPWRLHQADVQGLELFHIPVVGWFIKYLPILAVGFIGIAVLLRFFIRPGRRLPVFIFTTSLLFTVANLIIRPFSRAAMLSQTLNKAGDTVVNFVVTGVLPLTASTAHDTVTAVPGQFATIVFKAHESHKFSLTPALDNPYLVIAMVVADSLPLLLALAGQLIIRRKKAAAPASQVTAAEVAPAHDLNDLNELDALLDAAATARANVSIFEDEIAFDIDQVYRNRVLNIDAMYEQRLPATV